MKADVVRLNATRKKLCKTAGKKGSEYEVHWQDIIDNTRGVDAHRTTVAKAFKDAGLNVAWRTSRTVMPLTDEVKEDEVWQLMGALFCLLRKGIVGATGCEMESP